jgi:hypothetical protein
VAPARIVTACLVALALASGSARALPLVEFDFDEGSGTTARNSGTLGSALDGTIDGAAYTSDTPSGTGTALVFDGVNDFVRVTTSFSYGSQLTVEAWLKPGAVNGQRVIWDDYGNPGVLLAIVDGRLQFSISTPQHPGLGISLFSPIVLCEDEWIHVAGIYDGTSLRTFVNGEWTGDLVATSGAVIDNTILQSALGSDNLTTTALNFAGAIDDFRIHPEALEASALGGGLAGEGHDCPEPSAFALIALGLLLTLSRCRSGTWRRARSRSTGTRSSRATPLPWTGPSVRSGRR